MVSGSALLKITWENCRSIKAVVDHDVLRGVPFGILREHQGYPFQSGEVPQGFSYEHSFIVEIAHRGVSGW